MDTARRLGLVWGLQAIVCEPAESLDDVIAMGGAAAVDENVGRTGDRFLVVAGLPLHTAGVTNVLQLAFVRSSDER